jgi:hypothetical protein
MFMEAIMRCVALCAVVFVLLGCTNVAQMQRKYQAGDESQLSNLTGIAGRQDYPYGTRRKAARALGEIGDPRAVPVLTALLFEYGQRITLKQEALIALSLIGDREAVPAIGRMLDAQLGDTNGDVRMTAMEALGKVGGEEAAVILVNALRYYDVMLLRREQRSYRGVFSGEEQLFPQGPYGPMHSPLHPDSTVSTMPGGPRVGGFRRDGQQGEVSMFGTELQRPVLEADTSEEEQAVARAALVKIGEDAVPAIGSFLYDTEASQSLTRELHSIVAEIRQAAAGGPTGAAADTSAAVAAAASADSSAGLAGDAAATPATADSTGAGSAP